VHTPVKKPVQDVGQVGRRLHLEALRLGVHVALARREHHVATGGRELLAVGFQGARVGVEILVRRELQPVDEDAGHRHIAQGAGGLHQGQVAGVQVAHGGHEGGRVEGPKRRAQVGDGVHDLHGHQA